MAQTSSIHIRITSLSPPVVKIEGASPVATDIWSFRNVYAGVVGLANRIENFHAASAQGESISVKQLAAGEFLTTAKASRFSYIVRLNKPTRPADHARISWLNDENGLLMLADLLPQAIKSSATKIEFAMPSGWTGASNSRVDGSNVFVTEEPEKAVFVVGRVIHQKSSRVESTDYSLVSAGVWPFSDADARRIVGRIIKHYAKVTGFKLRERAVLMLLPFPGEVGAGNWSAEARGNAVVLLIGRRATREQLLARLGVVLTHELLHLWVPNSLKLKGEYDWFFEGFTLYQALLGSLHLGFIDFQEYLNTLARVYDSYQALSDRDQYSLLEMSERRWTGAPSMVYDKGMLVAMLYDLMLRKASEGKASLDDLYRRLFRRRFEGLEPANEVIITALEQAEGLKGFSADYLQKPATIDLKRLLASYGIDVQSHEASTRLKVATTLSREQQRLLKSLGYRGK